VLPAALRGPAHGPTCRGGRDVRGSIDNNSNNNNNNDNNTKRTRRAIDWNAVHARDEARTIRNKESIRERQKRLKKRHQRWLKC
jgi:hypothetical protein